MSRLDEIAAKIRDSGVLRKAKMKGCSEKEIASLEKEFGKKLPTAYREFLGLLGRGAGSFMSDLEMFFPEVAECNAKAEEILSWEEGVELPETAFVFMTRYGEQFLFFEVDERNPDPPIYYFKEDAKGFKRLYDSIWDFVEDEIEVAKGAL